MDDAVPAGSNTILAGGETCASWEASSAVADDSEAAFSWIAASAPALIAALIAMAAKTAFLFRNFLGCVMAGVPPNCCRVPKASFASMLHCVA